MRSRPNQLGDKIRVRRLGKKQRQRLTGPRSEIQLPAASERSPRISPVSIIRSLCKKVTLGNCGGILLAVIACGTLVSRILVGGTLVLAGGTLGLLLCSINRLRFERV
jgi:hypothetical protein